MRLVLWLVLGGCGPATAVLGDADPSDTDVASGEDGSVESPDGSTNDGADGVNEDGSTDGTDGSNTGPNDGDTDNDGRPDEGPPPDEGGGAPPPPPPPPEGDDGGSTDPGGSAGSVSWEGSRVFSVEGGWGVEPCTATVTESGVEVSGDPAHEDAASTCGSCDYVFLVDVGPSSICSGISIATEVYRGVEYRPDGSVRLYRIDPYNDGWYRSLLANGYDGGSAITYAYTGEAYGRDFSVAGKVALERTP